MRSSGPAAVLRALLLAAPLAVLPFPSAAHDTHAGHAGHAAAGGAKVSASTVRIRLADTPLRERDGRDVRLVSDVLGDGVAVVNFVYTTCTTICPVSSATMAELQRRLGAKVGAEVQLVTLTTDPARDTASRLKEYSARLGAGPGWHWLTGRKDDIDTVLKAFGAYTPNPEDHPAMTLVGVPTAGTWTRLFGFASVDDLQREVEKALEAARHAGHRR